MRRQVMNFLKETEGKTVFVFDTETTGLSTESANVVQFSAAKATVTNGVLVKTGELDLYIKYPGMHMPPEVSEINGITDELLEEKGVEPKKAFEMISSFLGDNPYLIAYNIPFDAKFMTKFYFVYGNKNFEYTGLDALAMVRNKLPKPHKLINACEYYGIAEKYAFHNSMEDVCATMEVFNHLVKDYMESVPACDSGLVVTGLRRWTKSESLDRIYVANSLNASIYYDVASSVWIAGEYEEEIGSKVEAFCKARGMSLLDVQ